MCGCSKLKLTDIMMERKFLASAALAWWCAAATAQTAAPDSTGAAGNVAAADSVARQVALDGVTVEGRTAIQKADHTVYMPTRRQADASNSGISLLSRMMIPKLVVDNIGKGVKNADGTTPAIYIDNRKADPTEADRLRPKDIVRVEYYDRPTASFPGEKTLLNFITRKYDRGGYVDLRTRTYVYPWLERGSYSAQAGFDTKKLNFTLYAGTNFANEETDGASGTEYVGLAAPFTKRTTGLGKTNKTRTHYGMLRTTYRTEKTTAYLDLGLNWSESPTSRDGASVDYSPQAYTASVASTDVRSRNVAPSASLFLETMIAKGHRLRFDANYVHDDNSLDRTYTEGSLPPVVMNTEENQDMVDATLTYMADVGHGNSFSCFVYGNYRNDRVAYWGTSDADQGLSEGSLLARASYQHTIARRVGFMLSPGIYWDVYRVKGFEKVSKAYFWPQAGLNVMVSKRSAAYFNWSMATTMPELGILNNTEQRVNQYTVMRGNPYLDVQKNHFLNAGYSLSLNNANISVYGGYTINNDYTKPSYFDEAGTLVSTYITDGKFVGYTAGASASLSLLKRSLQLSATVNYSGQRITGLRSCSNDDWMLHLSGNYYIKNFSVSAQYITRQRIITGAGFYQELPPQYGVELAWHHKGLNVTVGSRHFFSDDYTIHTWGDYGIYRFDFDVADALRARVAYVELSYSFDFGRKKVKREKMEVQKGSSGIMKL